MKQTRVITIQPQSKQPQSMELKYCERCGNLWLRCAGAEGTLCAPCTHAETAILQGPVSFLRLWSRLRAEVQA